MESQKEKKCDGNKGKGDRRIGMEFPPVKSREEILGSQRAAVTQEEIRQGMQDDIPPVVRSVLELAHLMMSGHSQKLHASPGYQGGLFYGGSPFCFASGYRDGTRPRDMDDKGNHMKLKDPLTYGVLSLPVTAGYLCELHGKGVFDLQAPLVRYLPELENKLDSCVTARSVLAFDTVVDDSQVLRDAGARWLRPHFAWNVCAATQQFVYGPINRFFAGGSSAALTGQQQRENYVQYLRSSPRVAVVRPRPHRLCGRRNVSHFSVALLIAAVERQLRGTSFEASIRQTVFEPAQSHGAGYGPPALWRDPNEMFYQPRGLALQHQGFLRPVGAGEVDNCGPPLLNASLNLYAPVEDYGKLLLLSLDAIRHARATLGAAASGDTRQFYDFGVEWLGGKGQRQWLRLTRRALGIDYVPAAASFRYDCEHDLGCFGVANCGTRGACVLANTLSRMIQHLFVKHVISKGVDVLRGPDLDNPNQEQSDTETKFKRIIKKQEYTSYFKKHDAHKRF